MRPSLRPVPDMAEETARERAERLAHDANHAALAIADAVVTMAELLIAETVDLPTAIPAGVRDELRRMGEEMARRLTTITAIRGRR